MMQRAVIGMLIAIAAAAVLRAQSPGDQWLSRPVDDRAFRTYLDFFAYDRALPLTIQTLETVNRDGVQIERLTFQSSPGVRVPAVLYRTAGGGGRQPAVVLLHGGGAQGKDGAAVVRTAELFARAGWTTAAIDMQYFGERATDLLKAFSEEEKHERLYNQPSVYLSWVTQTVKDARRTFDLLVQERGADPKRVLLFGISRGGIVGSIVAAAEPRFAGTVLYYAGHFDAKEREHLPAACPANYIGRISPRPLLMVNGIQDSDMIKDRAVDPWFRLAREPKQIIWTDGGHMFTTEESRVSVIQWMRTALK
jgi:dienelactone hydrolase